MKKLTNLLAETNKQYAMKLELLNLALQVDWETLPVDTPLRCWNYIDILHDDKYTDKSGFVAMYAGYSGEHGVCIFRGGQVSHTAGNGIASVEIAVPLSVGNDFVKRHGLQK